MRVSRWAMPAAAVVAVAAAPVAMADGVATDAGAAYAIDNMFLFVCAVLVLFMQAGFAMLEAGLNSGKNTVNILTKNLMDLSFGVLVFWLVGFNLMYPSDPTNGVFAWGGLGIGADAPVAEAGALHPQLDFLFQVAFAATAATIVSGAVAGRMKFGAYVIYSIILTGLIYPVSGFWKWGGGWLDQKGFYDFAGSILVHAVGGFAGLAGAIVLGPRIGRFGPNAKPMPGHNLTFAALGVFILWIGWYGFNPGSQLAIAGPDNVNAVMLIAVNTTLSAGTGAVFALFTTWMLSRKPALSMALNGALAGLVGITATCDGVTNPEAMIIGAVAGGLVVGGIKLLTLVKIDDPVGAWPVHGLCGIWGGIATGIFGSYGAVAEGSSVIYGNMGAQILGSLMIPAYAFVTMLAVFHAMKAMGILRATEEEELKGLDLTEHGIEAYPVAP